MKTILTIMGAAAFFIVTGCSTAPVAVAPVGPNPSGLQTAYGNGQLVVYSQLSGRMEGNNQTWKQHSDYSIYDSRGHRLDLVQNSNGYYDTAPKAISLPPGKYFVVARAARTGRIRVPVLIKPGEVTEVHLDANWQPTGTGGSDLVTAPEGYPIGWRADAK